ncbi:DMT family transporter [Roseobacter sp. YSTF-M11]|uniref:DMT family transporter n=1 Tax=Roseobacter insulae TaxID=2859783 RepID=A0A9X1JZE1_9RHOB|nr:DMT family transporter [Roseobacter insulae]MBW4709276.1 DMT family transporter [Roseobacter insulae]
MTPAQQGHAAMLAFSALVAGSFSLGAQAANQIDPAALNAVRFVIAAGVIGLAALMTTGLPRSAFRAPWRYLLLGTTFAVYFVLMFEGLKTAPPVSAAAVFTLTPVMAAVFGWVLLRQITTPRMALALAIGAVGALWVIFRADLSALRAFEVGRGEAVYFAGCIAHAVYTPLVRKLNRGEPAFAFTFGMLVAGAVVLLIYAWPEIVATPWATLAPIVWVTLIYIALFASAATFVLLQTATLRLPSAKVMAYTYLTPSWVILWELALGNSVPGPVVFGGVAITIVALLLLLRDETAAITREKTAEQNLHRVR